MDIGALLAGLQNVVALLVGWLTAHLQTQEQWMIFLAGLALIAIGAYSAWRAQRMGPYKISVFMVKLGFGLLNSIENCKFENAEQFAKALTESLTQ